MMKNIKARLAFGRGNVDKAQHFMVFGQMGLNSSAVALAPTPSAAFTTGFPVFQGIHWFKICHHRHTWNQTKLDVFTHYQLPSNGVYFLRNKHTYLNFFKDNQASEIFFLKCEKTKALIYLNCLES